MSTQLIDPQLDRRRLRERTRRFYQLLNQQNWERCFLLIDARLREDGTVEFEAWSRSLSAFVAARGPLNNVTVRDLKLYLDVPDNKHDSRPFAYGRVQWEDHDGQLHELSGAVGPGHRRTLVHANGRPRLMRAPDVPFGFPT